MVSKNRHFVENGENPYSFTVKNERIDENEQKCQKSVKIDKIVKIIRF